MSDGWGPMLLPPVTPAAAHLDDQDLLGGLHQDQTKHLSDCGWCRDRQRTADARDAGVDGTQDEFEREIARGDLSDSFRQAAARAVLPTGVRELMGPGTGAGPVAAGQLWRLTWKGRHLLAAVIDINAWHVLVAPVTTDTALADEVALLVPADQVPLATDLAVRVRQRASVPLFTLDRHLCELPPVGEGALPAPHALDVLVRAHRTGSPAVDGVPTGPPLAPDDADAVALADALSEQLAWFAGAAGALRHLPEAETDGEPSASPAGPSAADLVALLPARVGEAVSRTGIAPGRLLDLRRGAQATHDEIAALAQAAGVAAPEPATDPVAFAAALVAASAPQHRGARTAWTRRHAPNSDPDDPSELVHHLLLQPLAARTVTGQGAQDDEEERLRAYWRDRVALALAGLE